MYLEKINSPKDIKNMTPEQLIVLAAEVRKRIIDVISQNGGHLAPSLGTVELTLALLKVFNPPRDTVVWDVGHQAYAWKILTGRNNCFDTIRTFGGLSGFTSRAESPYDAFGAGHSSTSISAALGMAAGRDLTFGEGHCVAIIGDGALTGGMAFEALNHSGQLQKDKFVVILNDNEMSISKNVGGLQQYMARFLVSKSYNVLKKQVWDLSATLPRNVRSKFIYGAQKLEESLINILAPNIIFEDLGFKYVGPIDGHNIPQLLSILNRVYNNMVGPVLVHVVTSKGKGYPPAEKDAALFHGIGPFDPQTGELIVRAGEGETWSEAMGNQLCNLAEKQDNIVAITAAMSVGTGLSKFETQFPDRFFDVGIAEQHAVTFAAGLAVKGLKPFFAVYSTFLQRALDQVIHDVALQKLPVVFCIDRAGLVGEDGPTHHGVFDISFLSFIPNMIILSPSSKEELQEMLSWAADYTEGPVAIRYPRGVAFTRNESVTPFELGKAEVLREGEKIALLAEGSALQIASETAELLKQKKIQPWLVNLRSLKPLDTTLLDKLAKSCKRIFTFETNVLTGGVGSAIRDYLAEKEVKVTSFGYPDRFLPQGSIAELNAEIGFTPQNIFAQICALL